MVAGGGRHDWSSGDLQEELRRGGVEADFSSVFRALVRLERDGVVARVDLGDGMARFEPVGKHHEHVRCDACGAVAALPGCLVEGVGPRVKRSTGFVVTGHRVVLSGLCPACSGEGET